MSERKEVMQEFVDHDEYMRFIKGVKRRAFGEDWPEFANRLVDKHFPDPRRTSNLLTDRTYDWGSSRAE